MHDNYRSVIHQMEAFGIEFNARKDLPLQIDLPKRKTCGLKGKFWYRLHSFQPDAGGNYIVGSFGSYKTGDYAKVEVDWKPLSEAEWRRLKAEREAAKQRGIREREKDARRAAARGAELWAEAATHGQCAYLTRKRVEPEACRFLDDGSIVVPLIRYDRPRADAFRGVQRIFGGKRTDKHSGAELPDKTFSKGFDPTGAACRLGPVPPDVRILAVCEGYATGLSIRMATSRLVPVYVALNAGNLEHVVPILLDLFQSARVLICADDDWRTRNFQTKQLENIGRIKALKLARKYDRVHVVSPAFDRRSRGDKDTDFNDLHVREGLAVVTEQLMPVLRALGLQEKTNE